MRTIEERMARLAEKQLGDWAGLIRHWWWSYASDLGQRFDVDDLVNELFLRGHRLVEKGYDPDTDDAYFRTAYLNDLRDMIDAEKAGRRDYHRDVVGSVGISSEGNSVNVMETFAPGSLTYINAEYRDEDNLPYSEDLDRGDLRCEFTELIDEVASSIQDDEVRDLWLLIARHPQKVLGAWEAYKAHHAKNGWVARTDARTPFGYPWAVWSSATGLPVSRIKWLIHEVRQAVASVVGYDRLFNGGIATYARMQVSEETLVRG